MTDLLILGLIISAVLFFIFRKPRPGVFSEVKEIRPDIIEDSSHLKAQLAQTQQNYNLALKELGQLQFKLQNIQSDLQEKSQLYTDLSAKFDKLQGQKKSGEVRLGQISEQLLPLLPEFPVPVNTLKFFGQPLDYISIDLDSEWISFIELKSGGAVLSPKQRKIREMIENKKVRFFEVRIDEKGMKVK